MGRSGRGRGSECLPGRVEKQTLRRKVPGEALVERLLPRHLGAEEPRRLVEDLEEVQADRRGHERQVFVHGPVGFGARGRGRRGRVAVRGHVVDLRDVEVEFGDVEADVEGDGGADEGGVAEGDDEGYGGPEADFDGDVEVAAGGVEGGGDEAGFVAFLVGPC